MSASKIVVLVLMLHTKHRRTRWLKNTSISSSSTAAAAGWCMVQQTHHTQNIFIDTQNLSMYPNKENFTDIQNMATYTQNM